jgi:hypothetical protein
MIQFTDFIDITGSNASKAPYVAGDFRAYYATGSSGIEETAVQIQAARKAGMGIALYDQTSSLSVFARGWADIADIEKFAGTIDTAVAAVQERQGHGWQSTLYTSYDNLSALQAAIKDATGVMYGVADYSWSITQAENLLMENDDWAYVQYGDPESNPHTNVPGTFVTLVQCQADINVGRSSWADQFMPKVVKPRPPAYRHLTSGGKSFYKICEERQASPMDLLKLAARYYTAADFMDLATAVLPDGVPYYTVNP